MSIEQTGGTKEAYTEHILVNIGNKCYQRIEVGDSPTQLDEDMGIPFLSAIRVIFTVIKSIKPSEREHLAAYLNAISKPQIVVPADAVDKLKMKWAANFDHNNPPMWIKQEEVK